MHLETFANVTVILKVEQILISIDIFKQLYTDFHLVWKSNTDLFLQLLYETCNMVRYKVFESKSSLKSMWGYIVFKTVAGITDLIAFAQHLGSYQYIIVITNQAILKADAKPDSNFVVSCLCTWWENVDYIGSSFQWNFDTWREIFDNDIWNKSFEFCWKLHLLHIKYFKKKKKKKKRLNWLASHVCRPMCLCI